MNHLLNVYETCGYIKGNEVQNESLLTGVIKLA